MQIFFFPWGGDPALNPAWTTGQTKPGLQKSWLRRLLQQKQRGKGRSGQRPFRRVERSHMLGSQIAKPVTKSALHTSLPCRLFLTEGFS